MNFESEEEEGMMIVRGITQRGFYYRTNGLGRTIIRKSFYYVYGLKSSPPTYKNASTNTPKEWEETWYSWCIPYLPNIFFAVLVIDAMILEKVVRSVAEETFGWDCFLCVLNGIIDAFCDDVISRFF